MDFKQYKLTDITKHWFFFLFLCLCVYLRLCKATW